MTRKEICFTFRMSEEMNIFLSQEASERDMSIAAFVRLLIRDYEKKTRDKRKQNTIIHPL